MSRANQPDPDGGDDEGAAAAESVESAESPESTEDEPWKFGLDDVGPDGIVEETSPGDGPIEPESIDAEHAVFVALGVAVAVGTVLTIFL